MRSSAAAVVAVPERSMRRKSFADLGVQTKILTALAVAAVVAALVGLIGLLSLARSSAAADKIYSSNVASVAALGNVRAVVVQTRLDIASHAISQDKGTKAKYLQAFTADQQTLAAAFTAYCASHPAVDAAAIDELQGNYHTYVHTYVQIAQNKLIPASDRNDIAAWQKIRDAEVTP